MTFSISLYFKKDEQPTGFVSLLNRLLFRGDIGIAEIHEDLIPSKTKLIDINLSQSEWKTLVTNIINSSEKLEINISYKTLSGKVIPITLEVYGINYENGIYYNENNQICISVFNLVYEDELLINVLKEQKDIDAFFCAELGEVGRKVSKIRFDSEELFLRACGFLENKKDYTSHVEHASMRFEDGLDSPLNCFMNFHRETREFARDFARIYVEYHWGTMTAGMWEANVDNWTLDFEKLKRDKYTGKSDYGAFYCNVSPGNTLELKLFLQGFTEKKAKKLSSLPEKEIRERLLASEWTLSGKIRCYDLGIQGLVISANPDESLWPVYQLIAKLCLE